MRGEESMKTNEIRGMQLLNLQLANIQWTVKQWKEWCKKNGAGLHIEDGEVKGYDIEAQRYHR